MYCSSAFLRLLSCTDGCSGDIQSRLSRPASTGPLSVRAVQGFYDRDANIRALTATAGNVNAVR